MYTYVSVVYINCDENETHDVGKCFNSMHDDHIGRKRGLNHEVIQFFLSLREFALLLQFMWEPG